MKVVVMALLIGAGVLLPRCQAQPSCPYINRATTSGALGAQARLALRQKTANSDICKYVAGQGNDQRWLYVAVHSAADPKRDFLASAEGCAGKPLAVRALGNEAWSCHLKPSVYGMVIFGRVRDTWFLVRVSGIPDAITLQDKTALAAEQVANSLY